MIDYFNLFLSLLGIKYLLRTSIFIKNSVCYCFFNFAWLTWLYTWYLYISYNTLLLLVVVSCCSCYCASLQKGSSINNVTRKFPTDPFPPNHSISKFVNVPIKSSVKKRPHHLVVPKIWRYLWMAPQTLISALRQQARN